ncbi:MAG: hypothetical protein E5V56_15325 [Mesorhizobium sp.]|nr:MAG: hypothetical protein E5V56_15325 [Mesorhizobium sp.]TJX21609.1 MAG: hypothetical protein E5W21_33815 [Mesorhizobium sp.]
MLAVETKEAGLKAKEQLLAFDTSAQAAVAGRMAPDRQIPAAASQLVLPVSRGSLGRRSSRQAE